MRNPSMDSALRVSLRDPTPFPTALFGPVHILPLFWAIVPAMARQNRHCCHRPATFSLQPLKSDRLL